MADLEKLYAALDKADAAGETQDANDIAAMIRGQMAQPSKPEDVGFLTGSAAALKGGIESLGDVYSGLSLAKEATIGTEAETARKMQAIKVAQQQQPQTPQLSAADIERVYKEQGLGAAAAQVPKYISESILQSAPQMAVPLAAGAAASPFLTPIGGALVGMGTYGIQQFGNFLVRQAQEKNNPKDLEVAKAATTAAITAPLGYYADKFTAGIGGMVEKKAGEEILKELTARQIAAKVGKRAAVGATEGIIAEAPVEVLEQAAERYQAGLSLTGEDAMKEYKEAFFGAAAAGAGIGGVSRGVSAYREGRGQELPPVPPTPPKEEQAEPTMVPASQSQDTNIMMAELEGRQPEPPVEPPKPPPIQAAPVQPPIQAPVQTTVEAAPKTAPEAVLPIQETPKELPVKPEELPHPYQSELTQLYKQRNALSKEKDNLNVWLRKVGINTKEKADMGIERGSKDYPYVFRSNAQGLDVLMHDAIESGIITESDLARYPDPVEGFREMAKAAIDGQTANTPKNMETIANLEAIDSRIEKLESIPKEDYALHAQALEQATTEQERAKAEEDAQAQAEMDRLAEESKQNALPPTGEQDEDIQFAKSSMEGNTPAEKAANTLKNNGHSAEIVYDKDGISLIKTINPRNGDVIYVPSKNGVTFSQMHDVDSKNGALQLDALKLNPEQKNNLITARNELEKQEEEKHKKTPFLSMKSGLSGSPKAPKDIVNIARGWVKMLGMDYLDIHIITKEEAAANKDNFTGPHRPIGWMGEKLQQGAVRRLDDGSYALVLRPSTSKTKMLEIIAHEIGHIHEKFAFDSASEYTQKKIIKEFNAWFDTHGNISAKELVESMRPRAMARATRFEDPMMQASKAKAYWRSFGEWYADQVARWATSSEKPLTVVDKFFKKIADALKKFYATVKGQKYLPTESMKNFLDNIARQNAFDEIADRKNKGQMALFADSLVQKTNKTDTPEFKRWFGDSKVVNEDGSPMVMYHGTNSNILKFNKNKIGKNFPETSKGFYFTNRPRMAGIYSDSMANAVSEWNPKSKFSKEVKTGANIVPVYLSLKNPKIIDITNNDNYFSPENLLDENNGKAVLDAKKEGYDGLIIKKNVDSKFSHSVVVAFEPTQIKSAIGNNGEYSLENNDIRYELSLDDVNPTTAEKIQSIFGPTKKSTIKEKFEELKPNFYNRVITGLFDEFRPIKNYGDEAYMKAVLSKTTDGALEGLLMHGHVTLKDGALDIKQGTKGLLDILKPLGADVERYQVWKALNRDANLPENKRSFKDLIPQRNELLNGNINGVPRKDIYQKVLNEENKLNKSVLDVAKAQGTIDDEAYERFSNDIYYIPFYKAMENGDIVSVQDSSKLTGQYFSKALKGGEKEKMGDLMENTLRNWSHILSASMKNAAAISTLDSAVKLEAAEEVKSTYEGKNVLTVMKNGKKAYYAVTDPNLVESISMISFLGPKSPFLDVAKGFTNALRVGVTLAPGYKLRNLIRDTVSSAAISPVGMNVLDNVQRGLKLSNKGNPTYVSAMAGGGVFELGAAHEGNQAALVKRLIAKGVKSDTVLSDIGQIKNVLKDMYEKYNEFGNKFENANRLALYDKMIKEGKSHLEASYAARDLLNFTGQGSWRAVKTISQVVPFFNTRLQGLYKLGRDGISPTSRVLCNMATGKPIEESDKLKAQRFSIVSTAVALASIGLYMAYKDDDDFKKREDWDRDNFWWFKVGDTAFRIPKPFEVGALGTIAERSVEQLEDENVEGKVFVQRLHSVIMDNLSMNPTPQFIKPMIDLYANKDSFTGAPIETSGMERLSKQERYTNNTSELAKALGGVTEGAAKILTLNPDAQGFSPIQMDYALKGYLGWLGSTVASVSDKAVQPWSDVEKPSKPSLDQYAMGFAKSLPETQSKFVTEFYDNSKRINEAFADMKRFAEHGEMEKVANIMAEKGNLIALQNVYNQTTTQMAEYRKYINIITTDKKMSKEDKENEITRMKLLISQLAENAETMRKSLNKK